MAKRFDNGLLFDLEEYGEKVKKWYEDWYNRDRTPCKPGLCPYRYSDSDKNCYCAEPSDPEKTFSP